jgi:hypothetical protein
MMKANKDRQADVDGTVMCISDYIEAERLLKALNYYIPCF